MAINLSGKETNKKTKGQPNTAVGVSASAKQTRTEPMGNGVNGGGNPYEYRNQAFQNANQQASANSGVYLFPRTQVQVPESGAVGTTPNGGAVGNNPYEYRDQAFKNASQQPSANGGVGAQNPLLARLAEEEDAKNKQYEPGSGGKGVVKLINNNMKSEKPQQVQTEKQRRQQVQNIAAIGDVLRHAANLYYVSKGATPQNIQSQVAMNQAKWDAEDKLEAAQQKAQQEMELKRQKQEVDAAYKAGSMQQRDIANQIAAGNLKVNEGRLKIAEDMAPYNQAAKQAGIDNTNTRTEYIPKNYDEKVREFNIREGRIANNAGRSGRGGSGGSYSTSSSYGTGSKLGKNEQEFNTYNGVKYVVDKEFYNNIATVYNKMKAKGLVKDPEDGKVTKAHMIDSVKRAADSNDGHQIFVYWARRLGKGYRYVNGMSEKQKHEVMPSYGYSNQNLPK